MALSFLENCLATGYSTHFVGNSRPRQRSIVKENVTMTKEGHKFSSFAVLLLNTAGNKQAIG